MQCDHEDMGWLEFHGFTVVPPYANKSLLYCSGLCTTNYKKKQLEEDTGPFVLINLYSVDPNKVDEFLKAFAAVSEAFRRQPSYTPWHLYRISSQGNSSSPFST